MRVKGRQTFVAEAAKELAALSLLILVTCFIVKNFYYCSYLY